MQEQKETEIWIENIRFKSGSRLDWRVVDTFQSGYKLIYDQLVNTLMKNLTDVEQILNDV